MKSTIPEEKSAAAFVRFTEELTLSAHKVAVSTLKIEQAYNEINTAILKLPMAKDQDNVVRQGLMESILRRDMHILLASIIRMKKSLIDSIQILIKSGEAALHENRLWSKTSCQDEIELINARIQLARGLDLLRGLEQRLCYGNNCS